MYRQRVALDPILERQRHGGQKAQLGKDAPPGDKLRRLVDRCPDDVERRTAKLVGAWKRRGLDPQPPRDAARLGGDVFSIMCSCAVRARLAPVLELLLDEEDGLDADPNLATPSGLTPLHLAAEYDNFAAVACLIRHGADPEMREHAFDRQPLHMAASYAAPATVMLLCCHDLHNFGDRGPIGQPRPNPFLPLPAPRGVGVAAVLYPSEII